MKYLNDTDDSVYKYMTNINFDPYDFEKMVMRKLNIKIIFQIN